PARGRTMMMGTATRSNQPTLLDSRKRKRVSGRSLWVRLAVALTALVTLAPRSAWSLATQQCLSDDNHVYLIITTNSSNIGTEVTSVALNSAGSCSLSEIGVLGAVLTAYATGPGPLLPNRMR